ncbi:hypothetical protein DFH11DRAFT_1567272 [Phellopilus nigrolimitatus]|nr:hypothetical protein DFH11DRAFT_1567272 [Phellopilus nigrolimitatus]
MKVVSLVLAMLAVTSNASAQYFSEGWKPGQPVAKGVTGYSHQPSPTAAASSQSDSAAGELKPAAPAAKKSLFDLSSYLESAPVKALFSRAGVNITEKLETAREQAKIWDERVPLIIDDNFEHLVVEEKFETLEEERDRLWFIVISVSAAQREGISRFVDEQFDKAFDLTEDAGDLPHVRWGRIDYMNVTAITTKWGVWRAPFLVVLKDRGQTLRFYRPGQIRLQPEILREFLKQDAWEQTQPWRSAFAPGGSREFIMDYFAIILTKMYDITVMVPRWLLLVVTGTLASFIVNLLHNSKSLFGSSKATPALKPAVKASEFEASPPPPKPAVNTPTKSGAKSGGSKRKGGKR